MDMDRLKITLEGALLAAGQPLSLNQLNALFPEGEQPGHGLLRQALAALDAELAGRAVELKEVASGYRLQIRAELMPVVSELWAEKPPRYSRALLETLAIIAYRQPITRGEIEQIRGVSLSANILRTLQERDWIKVVGHRDVPGKPELLGTSRAFLDYFNLSSLDGLPTLAEIKDLDNLEPELELQDPDRPGNETDTGADDDVRPIEPAEAGEEDEAVRPPEDPQENRKPPGGPEPEISDEEIEAAGEDRTAGGKTGA